MGIGAVQVADELLRPVALLAGLLRGTHVLDGRFDRTMVGVRGHAVQLVDAVDL